MTLAGSAPYSRGVTPYLVRARDVTGVEIRITRDCWENHILVRHPIMLRLLNDVESAIASPDVVHQESVPRETRFYYRRLPRKRLWILVIADMKPSGRLGFVKTAMVVDRIRPREIVWERP